MFQSDAVENTVLLGYSAPSLDVCCQVFRDYGGTIVIVPPTFEDEASTWAWNVGQQTPVIKHNIP